ncbi:J domain-containing protein [Dehalococcoidia bacterium]|nr:J domain-containing protein [Dehalococcoidia bacterium]
MRGQDWYTDFMNRTFEELMERLAKDCEKVFGEFDASRIMGQPGLALNKRAAYHMLGLEESASDEEVKKRYLSLVKRLHPDVAGRVTEHLFKLVQVAYEQIKRERGWL